MWDHYLRITRWGSLNFDFFFHNYKKMSLFSHFRQKIENLEFGGIFVAWKWKIHSSHKQLPPAIRHLNKVCKTYLLVHDGADELPDSRQRVVSVVEGDRLPGESDLKQEGDAMDGAPWACAAGGRLAAVRQPAAECGRRAGGRRRGGWGGMVREGGKRPRGGRRRRRRQAVVGRHWLLSVMSSRRDKGVAGERHPKNVSDCSGLFVSRAFSVPSPDSIHISHHWNPAGKVSSHCRASLRQRQPKRIYEAEAQDPGS